jgi:alpha-galactosidase
MLFLLALASTVVPLNQLSLSSMTAGSGSPNANLSIDGHPLSIGGRKFEHGVGTHAHSDYTVFIKGHAISFQSWVGVDDETGTKGSVDFQVFVNGVKQADSGIMRGGQPAKQLSVNLDGAKELKLVVTDAGDGIDWDHADWADASIEVDSPRVKLRVGADDPTMQIAHVDLTHTSINGPRVVGCTPGHDFIFRIPASGQDPKTFAAQDLPAGIALDGSTGVLSGTAPSQGTYRIHLKVTGPGGESTRTLTVVSGDHKLALTPPMGWNSWNVWGGTVTAEKVKAAADSFLAEHLADFGYAYVNIDDTWEGQRDPDGEIVPNDKFGSISDLATYVHGKGLKLGIYSSPGPKTCGGYEGSYQHEAQDAQTYAKWGIDYLKYDWCSYGNLPHTEDVPGYEAPYVKMRQALDGAPRDIVYSLCQYGMGDVYKWGHSVVGGNLWRTTGDIDDSWTRMTDIGFSHDIRSRFAAPGGWNDPDMLVVGRLGWGPNPHPTRLSGNEQIVHISLWSLLAAPLMIGCDLTQLDQFTKDVLMNPEVLDVDQDPQGVAAGRSFKQGDIEIWTRPLWDGTYAIGLFNRGLESAQVETLWSRDLGVQKRMKIRDLWRRKDMGSSDRGCRVKVPAHGAMLLRVG